MSLPAKPVPLADPDSAPYWDAAKESRLVAQQCGECGHRFFPPRPRCPVCTSANLDWKPLSGRGHVYTFCITRMALVRGFEPPYVVAVVELDDMPGSRITANIADCAIEAVKIGMPVEVYFEERGDAVVPQFRPVPQDAR
jgi:uncharacterized OB-fold protein